VARLGQNFLADPNLLDAIVRDAELSPDDVVLEVGAGEGVLTKRLAPVAAHVHAIEIDHGLESTLAPIAARPDIDLHWGDAMKLDLRALDPLPSAIVANLPYSIATPLILRTVEELPSIQAWTVMVQREIADRLRAKPGTRTYGAPSVLLQLCCGIRMLRPVGPSVFRPPPRVGSAVIQVIRSRPLPSRATREMIRAAFAHRRKSMARSLEHVQPGTLGATRAVLRALGLDLHVRAEALEPEDFPVIAEGIPWKASTGP
jgi:16S rRNA (adenine1518-N6/adenine1519-N6)-dimethyltransferase